MSHPPALEVSHLVRSFRRPDRRVVTPVDDTESEPEETVVLTLSPGLGVNVDPAHGTAQATIKDNDSVTVSVAPQDSDAAEPDPVNTGTLRFTRNGSTLGAVTANFLAQRRGEQLRTDLT